MTLTNWLTESNIKNVDQDLGNIRLTVTPNMFAIGCVPGAVDTVIPSLALNENSQTFGQ